MDTMELWVHWDRLCPLWTLAHYGSIGTGYRGPLWALWSYGSISSLGQALPTMDSMRVWVHCDRLCPLWTLLVHWDRIGPLWTLLVHWDRLGPLWTLWVH